MYHSHFFQVSNVWTTHSKGKRAFDILISIMMLVIFAPLMLIIAAWLRLASSGSVFYGHKRVGKGGIPFYCIKFRTMTMDADRRLEDLLNAHPELRQEWEISRKLRNDPRIVAGIGSFLRKTSLDELPQILNVLRGDMSIVGPRPIVEDELGYYGSHKAAYLSVRPGLTGPWQTSERSDGSYDSRVLKDANYVHNATLRTDISVIYTTASKLINFQLGGGY